MKAPFPMVISESGRVTEVNVDITPVTKAFSGIVVTPFFITTALIDDMLLYHGARGEEL